MAHDLHTRLTRIAGERRAALWASPLGHAMARFNINTLARESAFLAQVLHESAHLTAVVENLNYSADRLLLVFPKYFRTRQDAAPFHRRPDMIANRVYGGRMGNGPEPTGDGWRYRGRGLIQLTGRANYREAGQALGVDLEGNPDTVTDPNIAALTAAWFWAANGCNEMADVGHFQAITKRINGGLNGYQDRLALFDACMKAAA